MKKNSYKNNKGVTLIELILLILITMLVVFLAYEILNVFDNTKEADNPINSNLQIAGSNAKPVQNIQKQSNTTHNIEIITPKFDEEVYQTSEIVENSNHYYYKQLDEPGKIIYKGLEDNIENMKSGNYKIDFGKQFDRLLKSDGGADKLNMSFQSAWNAFSYDYPAIFYIDVTKLILTTKTTVIAGFSTHKVSLSNHDNANYFADGISSERELREKEAYIENIRNNIINRLQGYSKYEKIKYLHDWIINECEYDISYRKKDIHNVYGALANKVIVCEGYARTLKYILDGLGIENILVSGNATNSNGDTESHAWNYVCINDKWYAIDTTWDDPIIKGGGVLTNNLRYKYFLKGSSEFSKNHVEDGYLSSNSIKFKFPTLERSNY